MDDSDGFPGWTTQSAGFERRVWPFPPPNAVCVRAQGRVQAADMDGAAREGQEEGACAPAPLHARAAGVAALDGARRTRGGCRLGGVCAECVDDKSRLVLSWT